MPIGHRFTDDNTFDHSHLLLSGRCLVHRVLVGGSVARLPRRHVEGRVVIGVEVAESGGPVKHASRRRLRHVHANVVHLVHGRVLGEMWVLVLEGNLAPSRASKELLSLSTRKKRKKQTRVYCRVSYRRVD